MFVFMKLAIGFALIGGTVAIHAIGSALWLGHFVKRVRRPSRFSETRRIFQSVLRTTIALLALHLLEAMLWAVAYYFLPNKAGLASMSEAAYFSIVTFTTLGYGDVTLSEEWRFLAGMEAMAGITVFGLTTAFIFAVIQQIWKHFGEAPALTSKQRKQSPRG